MGFNFKLPFGLGRKKDEVPEEERSYKEQEDSGNEDGIHMDSSNPFEEERDPSNPFEQAAEEEEKEEKIGMDSKSPFEGEISFKDVKDTRQGRKLKKNVVMGIVAVIVIFCVAAVARNLLKPKEQLVKQPQQVERFDSASTSKAMETRGIPSNYEDLAKYEKDMREKAKKAEEDRKRKEEADRRKKLKEEQERLEKERLERERLVRNSQQQNPQYVQTPRVNVNNPNQVMQQPQQVQVMTGRTVSEQKAIESHLAFGMGNNANANTNGGSPVMSSPGMNVNLGASYRIQAGTIVPATLLSGLNGGSGSADVVAQVRQDIYDSLTGQHLLVPQGSKIVGKVSGTNGRRLSVSFQRIILPDGSNLSLPSQMAADKSGYPGMRDKYDNHDSDFIRGALIGGVMAWLADEVDAKAGRSSSSDRDGNHYNTALNDTVKNITDHITRRSQQGANASPNVQIRPGYQFNVFINVDLSAYEYMR